MLCARTSYRWTTTEYETPPGRAAVEVLTEVSAARSFAVENKAMNLSTPEDSSGT